MLTSWLPAQQQIRTTYWSMPTEGQEEGQQEDASADKPATPKAPPPKASESKTSKVNFFDEEEDAAPAVAPRKVQSVEDALARAVKTELSVKVDTSGAQNPKTKGPEEFALPQRTVNPLKPAPSAAAAGSGKVMHRDLHAFLFLHWPGEEATFFSICGHRLSNFSLPSLAPSLHPADFALSRGVQA